MTFITKHFSFKGYDHIHPKTLKLDNLAMLTYYMLMDPSNNNVLRNENLFKNTIIA